MTFDDANLNEARELWPAAEQWFEAVNRLLFPNLDLPLTDDDSDAALGSFEADPALIERQRRRSIFDSFRRHQECFTANDWGVVALHFGKGLSIPEIATKLKLTEDAVRARLGRARKKKEQREVQLRSEAYRLGRRMLDE